MRAQAIARLLRHATEVSFDAADGTLWEGVYALACEVEEALQSVAALYTEVRELNANRP